MQDFPQNSLESPFVGGEKDGPWMDADAAACRTGTMERIVTVQ
jgi:hypothetical protein